MEGFEYGQPIPEKYRNRLFVWAGGGYEGCFWEPNAGLVDGNGIWHPIYSTGRDGIDDKDWYDRKIENLKNELGYDCRDVSSQYHEKLYIAIKEVFGDEWYEVDGVDHANDPRVLEKVKKDQQLYDEFVRRRDQYKQELAHREASLFMQAFDREIEDDRPEEVGLLDDEHAKATCARFCDMYKENVGFMAHVLDGIEKCGYEAWATCTDCGEQFQSCFDSFSCHLDNNAYTGNGGIGVIMKRIMCEDCMGISECDCCNEYDLPNTNAKDGGERDSQNYDLFDSVMLYWLHICWGCSNGFFRKYGEYWDENAHEWVKTPMGEKYYEMAEEAEKKFGEQGHKLYELMENTIEGRKMINKIRDLFEKPAAEYDEFKSRLDLDDTWLKERLDESVPKQEELKLTEENKEVKGESDS